MITLCPTTYEKASKMTNFSAWVRRKLLDDEQTEHAIVKYFAECERCGSTWSSYNRSRVPYSCGGCLKDGHNPNVAQWTQREDDAQ